MKEIQVTKYVSDDGVIMSGSKAKIVNYERVIPLLPEIEKDIVEVFRDTEWTVTSVEIVFNDIYRDRISFRLSDNRNAEPDEELCEESDALDNLSNKYDVYITTASVYYWAK